MDSKESIPPIYVVWRPARLHRLTESILWNRFLGSLNVYKFGLWWELKEIYKHICRGFAFCWAKVQLSQFTSGPGFMDFESESRHSMSRICICINANSDNDRILNFLCLHFFLFSDESHSPGTFCVKVVKQGPRGFICKYSVFTFSNFF
jgi:hypothetical protein